MATFDEALGAQPQVGQPTGPLHTALAQGTAVLSGQQTVSFTPYCRTILPADGWAFWLNAALLKPQQLAQHGLQSADPVAVPGSLHYASVGVQEEDQSIVIRKVDFTAMGPIGAMATAQPTVLWVASWNVTDVADPDAGALVGSFRFAISRRAAFYEEAGVWHLAGDAIYPVFEQELIDSLEDFDESRVVSNSLPIWLHLLSGNAPYPALVVSDVPPFPAWLVPANQLPPYAAVEIYPDQHSFQQAPWVDPKTGTHWDLTAERVKFTLYGLRNNQAMDFVDYLYQCADLTDLFGMMERPTMRDDHRPQVELAVLAQKKTVEMRVSYYQHRARDVAVQLIKTALVSTFAFAPYGQSSSSALVYEI